MQSLSKFFIIYFSKLTCQAEIGSFFHFLYSSHLLAHHHADGEPLWHAIFTQREVRDG